MSTVRINTGAIQRYFQARPFAGAGLPGLRSGSADRIAAQMVRSVRREAEETFIKRSGDLLESFRPIVRLNPRTGGTEVGVGSIDPKSKYLEEGTQAHEITPSRRGKKFLVSAPDNPTPLRGRRRRVSHPGNKAYGFIRKGVNNALGRVSP